MKLAERTVCCTAVVAAGLLIQYRAAAGDASSRMGTSESRDGKKHTILFEGRQWKGEYWTKDVPGGVETSPYTTAIYEVPADGSTSARRIPVDVEGKANHPTYGADGGWVHFQARKDDRWHLFRCRPDGSAVQNLTKAHTPPGDRFGYRISRDGKKILFTYNDGRIGRVGIMDPDGGNPSLVAPELGYHYMADISPDNKAVVFAYTAKGYTLMLKRLDTGELTALTPGLRQCFAPTFTADGKTIVFIRRGGDVYRVGTDGGAPRRLTEGNSYDTFYISPRDKHGSTDGHSLSPDGKRIAYVAMKNGVSQLHIMESDGTNQRQLTFRRTPCGRATFGPDGRQIAFVSWQGRYVQLFVTDTDGGEPRQLTDIRGAVYSLAWKPKVE